MTLTGFENNCQHQSSLWDSQQINKNNIKRGLSLLYSEHEEFLIKSLLVSYLRLLQYLQEMYAHL